MNYLQDLQPDQYVSNFLADWVKTFSVIIWCALQWFCLFFYRL